MQTETQNRLRLGLIPLMIDLYDRLLPDLRSQLSQFSLDLATHLTDPSLDVVVTDLVCKEEEIECALTRLSAMPVDLLVLCHMAYCPSGQILRALKGFQSPLLIWPAQSVDRIDGERFDEDALLRNHGVHGTQDLAAMLMRSGRPFGVLHGHWQDPDFRTRLLQWTRAGRALKEMKQSRPLQWGGHFPDMLDLQLDESRVVQELGITCERMVIDQLSTMARQVSRQEMIGCVQAYREEFVMDPDVDEDLLLKAARHEMALRHWIMERDSKALGINFLGLCNDPDVADGLHVAVSRLMAEGIGYGGEGDWLTAAWLRGLLSVNPETTFSEMFSVGYQDDRILLRHWGEGNVGMAGATPLIRSSTFKDSLEARFAVVDLEFAPGPATILNLSCDAEGRGRILGIPGQVLEERLPRVDGPRGIFQPEGPVSDVLDAYAEAGGTHHLALSFGRELGLARCISKLAGWTYVQL